MAVCGFASLWAPPSWGAVSRQERGGSPTPGRGPAGGWGSGESCRAVYGGPLGYSGTQDCRLWAELWAGPTVPSSQIPGLEAGFAVLPGLPTPRRCWSVGGAFQDGVSSIGQYVRGVHTSPRFPGKVRGTTHRPLTWHEQWPGEPPALVLAQGPAHSLTSQAVAVPDLTKAGPPGQLHGRLWVSTSWGLCCHHPHLTGEKTGFQRGSE